jgi:kynureninase
MDGSGRPLRALEAALTAFNGVDLAGLRAKSLSVTRCAPCQR